MDPVLCDRELFFLLWTSICHQPAELLFCFFCCFLNSPGQTISYSALEYIWTVCYAGDVSFLLPDLKSLLTCCANSEAASGGYSSLGFWHISRSQIKENWVGQALFFSPRVRVFPSTSKFSVSFHTIGPVGVLQNEVQWSSSYKIFFSWPTVAVFSYCWPIFLLFKVPVD